MKVQEWQQLWASNSHHKTSPHLLHVFSTGLRQPSWIHHNPVPTLTLYPKTSQRPAILRRGPLATNLQWNTPTSIGNRLWVWRWRPPSGRTGWSHVGWGSSTRQQGIPLHPWDSEASHPTPTSTPVTSPLQPNQGLPDTPHHQPNQVEVPPKIGIDGTWCTRWYPRPDRHAQRYSVQFLSLHPWCTKL